MSECVGREEIISIMNDKRPNKDYNEDEAPLTFETQVLTCLADLNNNLNNIKKYTESMSDSIRALRIEIHGEDVDEVD